MTNDAKLIMDAALRDAMPGAAVKQALGSIDFGEGKIYVVAAGKAAWEMGRAASDFLGEKIERGIIITKYDHSHGELPHFDVFEAGHPVPDENSYASTAKALEMVERLDADDNVLFLLSGGGSALFESPVIDCGEMEGITKQLLACGADIVEMNTIRKRLSGVKGGRFAIACSPAHVYTVVLSDIIGDPLDMIASGPAYPDSSTCEQAMDIIKKYKLVLSDKALECVQTETPKKLDNVTTFVTGSVKQLCKSAAEEAAKLGYKPVVLTSSLNCEAREAGAFLSAIAREYQNSEESCAFFAGGETVVHLTGTGKGGRNQEIALAAAPGISGLKDTCIYSFGSDGTDGPTDAAGAYADGDTMAKFAAEGIDVNEVLKDNDAYHAFKKIDGLIITGATGTNVNDLSVVLIKR